MQTLTEPQPKFKLDGNTEMFWRIQPATQASKSECKFATQILCWSSVQYLDITTGSSLAHVDIAANVRLTVPAHTVYTLVFL